MLGYWGEGQLFVVFAMPASDDRGGMGEAYEPVLVQAFISEVAVEGLDIGVLVGFAGRT